MAEEISHIVFMKSISVEALREKRISRLSTHEMIVDVRTPEEFAAGHVPGAINRPLDDLHNAIPELETYEAVFFICRTGGRSSRACRQVEVLGWQHAYNVDGGFEAWRSAGYDVEG